MSIERPEDYLISIVHELRKLPRETEWLEFKQNKVSEDMIGEYISALANSAALVGKVNAYMLWGIDDEEHNIIGTNFDPTQYKVGNEELENWLLRLLEPKINFQFHKVSIDEKNVIFLEVMAAFRHPVQFKGVEFIRVGTYKKKLKDFSEKARDLWRALDNTAFEKEVAVENVSAEKVFTLLDYPAYFELLKLPFPEGRDAILSALESEDMIAKSDSGRWNISNLGALLLAKKLSDFNNLKHKSIRVIFYKGANKVETIREQEGTQGYAAGFEGLIDYITNLLPSNEVIGKAFRNEVPMFPELAIRELVANALIHQDLHAAGTAPLIEIFSNRMEISNPGRPLVKTNRFLDSPPKSRNEALASFMRRVGICEQRGSGVDKVVFETEFYQLPAPLFETTDEHTRSVLFAHREFTEMDKADRIRACYLHACLRYVQRDFMTNSSLRERFGIEKQNSATVSRVIKDTVEAEEIRPYDAEAGRKYMKYVPSWY